jgi:hypothetical protein
MCVSSGELSRNAAESLRGRLLSKAGRQPDQGQNRRDAGRM